MFCETEDVEFLVLSGLDAFLKTVLGMLDILSRVRVVRVHVGG